jgi:hypothetical protein
MNYTQKNLNVTAEKDPGIHLAQWESSDPFRELKTIFVGIAMVLV